MAENFLTQADLQNSDVLQQAADAVKQLDPNERARIQDNLAEKADKMNQDGGRIPEKFLQPDREIQDAIRKDYMSVGDNHPYLKTGWVNYVNINGQMVFKKKAEGWQVATVKDFPEAKDLQREDGTIRIGDTILMCIRLDLWLQLNKKEEDRRVRQQFGIETEIIELGNKNSKFFKVYTEGTGGLPAEVEARIKNRATMAGAARSVAATALGNRMKKGIIPGVPIK